MDINKWKRRLNENIITRDMIDNMYVKAKITLEEYLYITGLEETDLIQEEQQSLSDKVKILSEENKTLKEQNEILNARIDSFENLIAEMSIRLNNISLK